MSFSNIYELYNNTFVQDQSLVNSIVNNIKFIIEDYIQEGEYNKFDYDTNIFLEGKSTQQKDRVIDQVIKYFRLRGVRARKQDSYYFGQPTVPLIGPQDTQINGEFNNDFSDDFFIYEEATYTPSDTYATILTIEWFIRNNQEFMKHYC